MYDKTGFVFTYTKEQTRLSDCQRRITGLVRNSPESSSEISRLTAAYANIKSRMPESDVSSLFAHENGTLAPEQQASLSLQASKDMDANRDKPSI